MRLRHDFKYPVIAQSWRRNWEQVVPFSALAPEGVTDASGTVQADPLNAVGIGQLTDIGAAWCGQLSA